MTSTEIRQARLSYNRLLATEYFKKIYPNLNGVWKKDQKKWFKIWATTKDKKKKRK